MGRGWRLPRRKPPPPLSSTALLLTLRLAVTSSEWLLASAQRTRLPYRPSRLRLRLSRRRQPGWSETRCGTSSVDARRSRPRGADVHDNRTPDRAWHESDDRYSSGADPAG